MADRTVYGRTHSENGWRMVDADSCPWVKVPGTNVTLRIREGQPAKIMAAFAADYNAYVEPLRDADSACWTPTNSVASSNHLSGTGMDLNWNGPDGERFRLGITKEQAFPGPKAKAFDDLLAWYEGILFCGGYWSIRDWMHVQLSGNTYGSQHASKVNDFIARKIRADGFSTYKRGFGAPKPPVGGNTADILARATGLSHARATEILPTMVEGLKLAQCNTVPRIAQFIAHTGHESDGYKATEEYAKNGRYAPYIGRTWLMITWDYHYRDFSEWAHTRGLVPTPDYFVRDYRALADLRWAGIGGAWYWTEQRPMNALVDAGDAATWKAGDRTYRGFEAVTAAINGGLNGLADRRDRCRRAMNLGDQLLALVATPEPADPLEELLMSELESWSIYATPGEPKIPAEKMLQAIDAANHRELVENAARLGDVDALARIARTAKGLGKYTDAAIREHAIAVLAEIGGKTKDEIREILKG